jgi:HEPN domain-containing protein
VTSDRLARDYLRRARARRRALDTLLAEAAHADVVRESQEVVELVLKGALRFIGVDPPKRHDVRETLARFMGRLPGEWRAAMAEIEEAAAELARDRAHAFYGDEEALVPASELFVEADARAALAVVDRLLALYERLLATTGDRG